MSDFTPTTTQVRDAYVRAMRNAFIASASEHEQEFERWLKLELFKSRQDGYALRIADERDGIGADRDEWLKTPKENADTDELEHRFRRWLLEEATGNQGATVMSTVAPTAATDDVWRWPIRRNTDKAYWEDTDDCD